MDAQVQQTESSFTAEVFHFPLPTKFRMPQIEAFNGTKDPVDHLNTYKNQMEELHCETPENSNFLKNGKILISVKIQNFTRSRMTKRSSPLESTRKI